VKAMKWNFESARIKNIEVSDKYII
jgi:hypothetical protein